MAARSSGGQFVVSSDDYRFSGLLGRGVAMVYLSLIVLIPLAALLTNAFNSGLGSFWRAITQTEAIDAIRLTLLCSLGAALLNAVAGTATAWILVRDRFWGQGILNAIIDLPFALPTVVAGVTFYTLYGPLSPVHVNVTGSWIGITLAIMFVTLPFTVRSVQPVLESLTFNAEAAAATLGASSGTCLSNHYAAHAHAVNSHWHRSRLRPRDRGVRIGRVHLQQLCPTGPRSPAPTSSHCPLRVRPIRQRRSRCCY